MWKNITLGILALILSGFVCYNITMFNLEERDERNEAICNAIEACSDPRWVKTEKRKNGNDIYWQATIYFNKRVSWYNCYVPSPKSYVCYGDGHSLKE